MVRIERYRLPLRKPLRTAVGELRFREGALIALTDGPHTGLGEVAPLPGFSRETLDEALEQVVRWAPGEALPELPSARHGIDQAVLSLAATRAGRTLAEELSPSPRARVPVNALVADAPQAVAAVAAGYRTLKLKVGFAVDDDVQRVALVREAVGPAVALRLDANRGWTEPQAREALDRLAAYDIELVEEPTDGLAAMARLRGTIPIAADESVRDRVDLERVVDLGAADIVVIKPMLVGGPTEALALIDLAFASGLDAYVTTSIEAAPGRDAALAVAAARDLRACGLDTGRLLAADLAVGFRVERGDAIVGGR